MALRIGRLRRVIVPLLVAALSIVATAGVSQAGAEEPLEQAVTLAWLGYTNGVAVQFTRDVESRDFGLLQQGTVGRNGPVVDEGKETQSFLQTYLAITPRWVPVPQAIVESHPTGTPLPDELAERKVTQDAVRVSDLTAPASTAAAVTCWSQYYGWVQWYDAAGSPNPMTVFHHNRSYFTWDFGGMKQYSNSFVANCGEANVRHRIYYLNLGSSKKHWDSVVTPWHWQAVKKGSVLRNREVHYSGGWGYTRSGRFRN